MDLLCDLYKRQIKGCNVVPPKLSLHTIFEPMQCYKQDEHAMKASEEGGQVPLPFACSFSKQSGNEDLVAVANEDGKVHLLNTRYSGAKAEVKMWQAHVNAVFDLAWVHGEAKLVTGSGDQTAQLWDCEKGACLSVFKAHSCSLRSIAFKHRDTNVFATGARDGHVMIWDMRINQQSGHYKPVNILRGVHNTSSGKRRATAKPEAQQSVTAVLFKDEHSLYSSGAADGAVKLWDLRRHYTNVKGTPLAKHTYPYVGQATQKKGISSLTLTSCGSKLFASCTDDNIYCYHTNTDSRTPVSVYHGHTSSTFYIKTSISLDDRFLISGSSSQSVFLWQLARPDKPPLTLQGHTGEVTSVTCSPTDIGKIVSCSDDSTVRVWRLHDQMNQCIDGQRSGVSHKISAANYEPISVASLQLQSPPRTSAPSPRTPKTNTRTTPLYQSPRLTAIVEDSEVPGPSGVSPRPSPRSSPRFSSPPPSASKRSTPKLRSCEKTPGKISDYFISRPESAELKRVRQSPRSAVRQASKDRLKELCSSPTPASSSIQCLELSPAQPSTSSLSPTSKPIPTTPKKTPKPTSKPIPVTPKKTPASKPIPVTPRKTPGPKTKTFGTISTQTSPPKTPPPSDYPCNSSCKGCCKNYKPNSTSPTKTHPKKKALLSVSSPRTPTDFLAISTPKSLSNSSVPRRTRLTVTPGFTGSPVTANRSLNDSTSDLRTTPTRGNTSIIRKSISVIEKVESPSVKTPLTPHRERVETKRTNLSADLTLKDDKIETKSRRKFTRTGTPIHTANCNCTFCTSTCGDISEMSKSPINEMPDRPSRKRYNVVLDSNSGSSPKRRKSLFDQSPHQNININFETLESCSQEKENLDENLYHTPEKIDSQRVTVREWFQKIEPKKEVKVEKTDQEYERRDRLEEKEEEEDEVIVGHDHSKCKDLKCIRSFFKCKQ